MKLAEWFKNLFNKKIKVADVDDGKLVVLAKNGAKIKIGASIEVKPNFVALLCAGNKVADIFTEGNYRLDTNNMPLLTRMLKLTRQDRRGNLPNKCRADIYYVNLKIFDDYKFLSDTLVKIKNKNYKSLGVGLEGEFSFKIKSPVDFMEAMFTQFGVVRNAVACDELCSWVADLAVKGVQKNKPTIEELYTRDSKCFEGLVDFLNKDLSDCGVEICKFEITNVNFPKKIYKNISLAYDELKQKPQQMYAGEIHPTKNPVEIAQQSNFKNQSAEVYLDTATKIKNQMDVKTITTNSDGSANVKQIDGLDATNYAQNNDTKNIDVSEGANQQNQNYYNSTNVNNQSAQNYYNNTSALDGSNSQNQSLDRQANMVGNFVGSRNNEVIQKTIQYKRCPNCGSFCAKDSVVCFQCGQKLN